jgi:hypothetical protein
MVRSELMWGDFVFDDANDEIREAAYRQAAVSLLKEPLPLGDLRTLEAIIFECHLCKEGIGRHRSIPVTIGADFQPRPAEKEWGAAILERLASVAKPLGNPGRPIRGGRVWSERRARRLSLSHITLAQRLSRILGARSHDFRRAAPLLFAKLSKLDRNRWRSDQ